ncbi:YegP family protein [Marivivens marinus]|uniref:YegP family protein n=1 Tax=Marivivens marinus TaxID=3110173 RepID=UPI003B848414
MTGKFELYRDAAGEFRFRLKASNGEILLVSEGYKQRASAINGIASVKKNAAIDAQFERKETKSGSHMFNLKASNGQVISHSESYTSTSSRDNGIESVKKSARSAEIIDASMTGASKVSRRTIEKISEDYRDELRRLVDR